MKVDSSIFKGNVINKRGIKGKLYQEFAHEDIGNKSQPFNYFVIEESGNRHFVIKNDNGGFSPDEWKLFEP